MQQISQYKNRRNAKGVGGKGTDRDRQTDRDTDWCNSRVEKRKMLGQMFFIGAIVGHPGPLCGLRLSLCQLSAAKSIGC